MTGIIFTAHAEPVSEINNLPETPAENPVQLPTMTSENSGLNPGYSFTPIQNSRPVPVGDKLPNVTALSAIVVEASTGHIIYARDENKKMFPASTTKMMTLIMALESDKLNEIVTVGKNAFGAEGSTLWLEVGDKIPLEDLLYGLIMHSGNDAAIAIAEHIDGDTKIFAEHMTKRARELGAYGTQFKNPNGLPDENHFTTAKDLATLAAHGFTLEKFEDIVSAKEKNFAWVKGEEHLLRNENQMLWLYRGGNGIKTGYTDLAGRCLVSSAKRDGVQIIAVVLDSLYLWNDSIALLDYGFENVGTKTIVRKNETIKKIPVVSGRKKYIDVKTANKIVVPEFKNDSDAYEVEYDIPKILTAPIKKGDTVGKISVKCDGKEIAATDIFAVESVEQKSFFRWLADTILNFFKTFDGG